MKTTSTPRKRVFLHCSLLLIAGFAALQGVAGAAVLMPEYDILAPMTDKIEHPADVAVDKQGRVYIAETTRHRVTVLSQSGRYTGKVLNRVVNDPISVAVDSNGRILVGSASDGSVSIFRADLTFVRKLERGAGEFGNPVDIAIDTNDNIYVVDKTNNAIKVYNKEGFQTGSIGTPGNGDGQLRHPTSIAIDENAGEIVVLDHQQVLDGGSMGTGKMVDGTRIQYFDMLGSSLRAYSKFGYNNAGFVADSTAPMGFRTAYDITMGQMVMAKQLAVDSMSRIYVTAARWNKVMVYDNYDNFLGTIDGGSSPLRIPNGIAIGTSNRLYVASQFTRKVEVFGVDSFTAMVTTPPVIEFNAVENGNAPPSQAANITNQGNASFSWTSSTPNPWVSLAATTGTLVANETASLDIGVNPQGFAPGKHTGSIVIDTGAGASEVINVVLTIQPNPLQVAGEATFTTTVGSTPAAQELVITSGAEGELLWDVSADQPWIGLSKTTGMTPDTLRVYADISSLAPGSHEGIITFIQQGDNPAPVEVPVSLTLTESTAPDNAPGFGKNGKNKWNRKWTISQLLPGIALNGVSGTSNTDVVTVGEEGTTLHFDGEGWAQIDTGVTTTLNSVWSDTDTNVYAVGNDGLALNFNGTDWTSATNAGAVVLQDIWGSSDSNIITAEQYGSILDSSFASTAELGVALRTVWGSADKDAVVAGQEGSIFRFDGNDWTPMNSNTTEWLNGIWGDSESNIYAVGENGTVIHYNGNEAGDWEVLDAGTTNTLNGVCGASAEDIYVVGDNSLILHFNGKEWSSLNAGAGVNLNDVWCINSDIFAVGDDGTIIRGKGMGKKFPWLRVIVTITDNASRAQEKEKEEQGK